MPGSRVYIQVGFYFSPISPSYFLPLWLFLYSLEIQREGVHCLERKKCIAFTTLMGKAVEKRGRRLKRCGVAFSIFWVLFPLLCSKNVKLFFWSVRFGSNYITAVVGCLGPPLPYPTVAVIYGLNPRDLILRTQLPTYTQFHHVYWASNALNYYVRTTLPHVYSASR